MSRAGRLERPAGSGARPSALVVVLVLAALGAWSWRSTVGGIRRDARVESELSAMPEHGEPVNFLVVGNDSREKIAHDAGERFGAVTTTEDGRADTVMLVRLRKGERTARILSLPRDLQLSVGEYGPQKLSSTLGLGGSRLLVRTVRELTGLPIHHYVELDFLGFARVVDSLGGIWMDFAAPARDEASGLEVGAGRQLLDGDTALALVRSRNYEEWHGGSWLAVGEGDRGRIERQHRFLRSIAGTQVDGSPLAKVRALARLGSHVTVDTRLSILEMVRLADRLSDLRLDEGATQTLPTQPVLTYEERTSPFPPHHVGGITYERLSQPAADAALRSFASAGGASSGWSP